MAHLNQYTHKGGNKRQEKHILIYNALQRHNVEDMKLGNCHNSLDIYNQIILKKIYRVYIMDRSDRRNLAYRYETESREVLNHTRMLEVEKEY